jgi:hypothetical protein
MAGAMTGNQLPGRIVRPQRRAGPAEGRGEVVVKASASDLILDRQSSTGLWDKIRPQGVTVTRLDLNIYLLN